MQVPGDYASRCREPPRANRLPAGARVVHNLYDTLPAPPACVQAIEEDKVGRLTDL